VFTIILSSKIAKRLFISLVFLLSTAAVSFALDCTSDADCGEREICKNPPGRCVGVACKQDSHCPSGKCIINATYAGFNKCAQCTNNSQCPQTANICLNYECVQCATDPQCVGKLCIDNRCQECTENSHCKGANMICLSGNRSDNRCGCNTNRDCRFEQQCDPRSHTCIAGFKQPSVIDPGKLEKGVREPIDTGTIEKGIVDPGKIPPGRTIEDPTQTQPEKLSR
jgi:hypothetical protein